MVISCLFVRAEVIDKNCIPLQRNGRVGFFNWLGAVFSKQVRLSWDTGLN